MPKCPNPGCPGELKREFKKGEGNFDFCPVCGTVMYVVNPVMYVVNPASPETAEAKPR